jgi:hypothetical protein
MRRDREEVSGRQRQGRRGIGRDDRSRDSEGEGRYDKAIDNEYSPDPPSYSSLSDEGVTVHRRPPRWQRIVPRVYNASASSNLGRRSVRI